MDAEDRRYLDAFYEKHAKVTEALIAAVQDGFREMAASMRELQAEIADQREQIQANTQGLLKVRDSLDG